MSSHREAPEISKDPVADSTDVYAFVSPDRPDTATLIANYIPLQGPAGGPNFYQFGDNVRYAIHIDTSGHSEANMGFPSWRGHIALKEEGRWQKPAGSLTLIPARALCGWSGRPASRSRRWP